MESDPVREVGTVTVKVVKLSSIVRSPLKVHVEEVEEPSRQVEEEEDEGDNLKTKRGEIRTGAGLGIGSDGTGLGVETAGTTSIGSTEGVTVED